MKKKKFILLGVLLIAAVSVLAGCASFKSRIDPEKHKWIITCDSNGGVSESREVRKFYVENESSFPQNRVKDPVRTYYNFLGWYVVEYDANGEIPVDESGNQIFGRKWDVLNDHIYSNVVLAAKWQKDITFKYYPGKVEGLSEVPKDLEISTPVFSPNELLVYNKPTGNNIPKAAGYTMLNYYWDKECTNEVVFPYTVTQEQQDDYIKQIEVNKDYNIPVYTKWLKGEYNLVYSARDFNVKNTGRYYLMNDIDMSDRPISQIGDFSGTIEGNGYKVSNMTITVNQTRNEMRYGGIFKSLKKGAVIRNLTFDNVTVNFEIAIDSKEFPKNVSANIAAVAQAIEDGVTLENFVVRGQMDIVRTKEWEMTGTGDDGKPIYEKVENKYDVTVYYYGVVIDDELLKEVPSGTSKDEDGLEFEYTFTR